MLAATGRAARAGLRYVPGATLASNILLYEIEKARLWRHFIGALLERVRDGVVDLVAADFVPLNFELFQQGLGKELDATENAPPEEARQKQRRLAFDVSLNMLPPEILYMILDRMCGFNPFDQSVDEFLDQSTRVGVPEVENLRALEGVDDNTKSKIASWMQSRRVQEIFHSFTGSYPDFETARQIIVQQEINREVGQPLAGQRLAWDCMERSWENFDFLLRHDIVRVEGYDATGQSWLEVATEVKNETAYNALLRRLTLEQCFRPGDLNSIFVTATQVDVSNDRYRTFMRLCTLEWYSAIEHLIQRVMAAHEDPRDYFRNNLRDLLCWVGSVELAQQLHRFGVNITSSNTRGTDEDLPMPSLDHSWLSAIRNSQGAEFLDWFEVHSLVAVQDVRTSAGTNVLMEAAHQGRVLALPWLFQRMDILEKVPDNPVHSMPVAPDFINMPGALYFAIIGEHWERSVRFQTFRLVLNALSNTYFWNLAHVDQIFKLICYCCGGESAVSKYGLQENRVEAENLTWALMARCSFDRWNGSIEQASAVVTAEAAGLRSLIPIISTRATGDDPLSRRDDWEVLY
ncbi:hypothetical protein N7492_010575 [Penicillium capsulatum]|uniref:Uncharacterized protein n=1 Tax=Penicillium capsulatum TaxID=69766 RepID=A0A9W9HP21_9EURO|nr:hypothetical protein N7492_010575 [Penicillium capsulatum]KAJ6113075.1 hypothetical protein N7512_008399 [Penicillium capsulatum]